jgi:hypothetical protein
MLNLKRPPRFAPRTPRIAAAIDTAVLLPDDREVEVQIRNISSGGFMAVSRQGLVAGIRFGVAIPGHGIVRAEVRWADEEMFGAQFERPLQIKAIDEG